MARLPHWRHKTRSSPPTVFEMVFSCRYDPNQAYSFAFSEACTLRGIDPSHPLPFFILSNLPNDPFPEPFERRNALLRRFVGKVPQSDLRSRNEILYAAFTSCGECLHAAILDTLFPKVAEGIKRLGKDTYALALECNAPADYVQEVIDCYGL